MTFGVPLFLLATLAAAIPLLLHLINRQQAKPLPFSTLRFLKISAQRTRRRKYLHDIVLLLLRMAALALIAIALSQPTIKHVQSLLGGGAETAVAIVLDNSLSMATVDGREPRWERALAVVETLLAEQQEGDQVALLLPAGNPPAEAGQLYADQQQIAQLLPTLAPTHQRADHAAALETAQSLLAESTAARKEVYLITDRQAVSFESLSADRVAAAEEAGDEPTPLIVVDVQQEPRANVSLARVETSAAAPVAGATWQAKVTLAGDVNQAQQRHVELVLDGQRQQVSPTLAIPPGESIAHTFQFVVEEAGLHHGEIRLLDDDANPLDDVLHFALNMQQQVEVAVVQPQSREITYLEDAYYLRRALQPVAGRQWMIGVTLLTADQLAGEELGRYAAVYCVNLPAPPRDAATNLTQYVQGGGHLVWIAGENILPADYAAMNDEAGGALLPVELIGVEEAAALGSDGWAVAWLDEEHPALKSLTEPASLYQSVVVKKRLLLGEAAGDDTYRTLARTDDGEPLLVHRSLGHGSVSLLATTAHVDWTNLPLRPIFLPLVSSYTLHLAAQGQGPTQLIAGQPLTVPVPPGAETLQLEVVTPSGEVSRLGKAPEAAAIRFDDTGAVGLYRTRLLNTLRPQSRGLAANPDPREMSPQEYAANDLAERLPGWEVVRVDDPQNLLTIVQQLRDGEGLWELFLLAVLLALVAESYVANRRLGSGQEKAGPPPAATANVGRSTTARREVVAERTAGASPTT